MKVDSIDVLCIKLMFYYQTTICNVFPSQPLAYTKLEPETSMTYVRTWGKCNLSLIAKSATHSDIIGINGQEVLRSLILSDGLFGNDLCTLTGELWVHLKI